MNINIPTVDRIRILDIHPKEDKRNIVSALDKFGLISGEHYRNVKKVPGQGFAFISFDSNEQLDAAFDILTSHLNDGTLKVRSNKAKIERVGPALTTEKVARKNERSEGPAPFQGMPYDEQLQHKAKLARKHVRGAIKGLFKKSAPAWLRDRDVMASLYSIPSITESPIKSGYRNKVDLSIGFDEAGQICVGMTKPYNPETPNTNEEVSKYELMPEMSKTCSKFVRDFLISQKVTNVYNKNTHEGYWRALRLRLPQFGVPLITIETAEGDHSLITKLIDSFDKFIFDSYGVHAGFYHRINSSANDSIDTSDNGTLICGPATTTEKVLDTEFTISPSSFFQCNTPAASELFKIVSKKVEAMEPTIIIDCCCGAGAIGCILGKTLKGSHRIVGVDIVPSAIEDAKANAKLNGLAERTQWICGPAEKKLPELFEAANIKSGDSVVTVLDPPRGGLHPKVIKMLRANATINKLVYVSCSPASLQRDLELLIDPSKDNLPYKVLSVEAIDLFPDTNHVETIVTLERATESDIVMAEPLKFGAVEE